jgi:hypothetical protein
MPRPSLASAVRRSIVAGACAADPLRSFLIDIFRSSILKPSFIPEL